MKAPHYRIFVASSNIMKIIFTQTSGGVLLALAMLPLAAKGQFTTVTNGDNTLTITGYTGSGGNLAIPNTINGILVKAIGDFAFQSVATITTLEIPDSVTSIGHNAFAYCSGQTRVTIGDGVTTIRLNAFYGNSSLTNVTIGNGIVSLEGGAFQQCGNLRAVYFTGNAPTSVSVDAFAADPVTIYRTLGSTGWSSTLASRPVEFYAVSGLAPVIVVQPNNQTVVLGNTSMLTVTVSSELFVLYQWRKDGVAILGATNSTIFQTNVTTNSSGYYDVVVSNAIGAVTSTAGVLQVLPYGAPSIRINGQLAAPTTFSASPALVDITAGFTNGLTFYTLDGTTPNIGSTI